MKKLIIVLLAIAFVGVGGIAFATDYEGEFNPADFGKWRPLKAGRCSNGHLHAIIKNPDPNHPVKHIEVIFGVLPGSDPKEIGTLAYHYQIGQVIYAYQYDPKTKRYFQVLPKPQKEAPKTGV